MVDANGAVIARSNDSTAELAATNEVGFTLVSPTAAGAVIADGESFIVTGPGGSQTYEFDKDGAVTGTNVAIPITNASAQQGFEP